MKLPVITSLFLLALVSVSFAAEPKKFDKDKLLAPGTSKDYKAPERPDPTGSKGSPNDPTAWNGSTSPSTNVAPAPAVPVNGYCPEHYDCVSTNSGATLRCRRESGNMQAVRFCARITEYCHELEVVIAENRYPEDLAHKKSEYTKYCS